MDDEHERRFEEARLKWPTVVIPKEVFVAHLAARASSDVPLASLRTSDLYLAAACATGAPAAFAAFEAAFLIHLTPLVRRVSNAVDVDELTQELREVLFVARADRPPKILQYSGRGELRAWVRVVVTRAALNAAMRRPKERPLEDYDEPDDASLDGGNPELAYFRVHYDAEVKAVLPLALKALSVRERLVLRQHYLDQLSLAELSRVHGVHVATIKRHLADARATLSDRLRALLIERLGLSPSEFESVMAIVRSRFHMTMRRLLPPGESEGA